MTSSSDYWSRAKRIIPGGNSLLSKRPEMYLPELWPTYFSKAVGYHVWDLDGSLYSDVSMMGVGTNVLGYANRDVNRAVCDAVASGNMSTLNCFEEVLLAEKLVSMHPWADMARFARTGGEANTIALRIARAASGKSQVAVCGYHGWQDWYLAANLQRKDDLGQHLLPGLSTVGVPDELSGTIKTFSYNNFDELLNIYQEHDIGVIFMEVQRNLAPQDGFLQKIRKFATDKNIVLVFDECTSGLRQTFGGLHLSHKVEPDIAVFGKTLGNGFPITAVIGRREIMDVAQSTFVSSTFWTERSGYAAALQTLQIMEKERTYEEVPVKGCAMKNAWLKAAREHDLNIEVTGLDSIPSFIFGNFRRNRLYKTFLTQEMLNRGYLANTVFFPSIAHDDHIMQNYADSLMDVFQKIAELELIDDDLECEKNLKSTMCHDGFRRLN